jgi:sugar O-acyltransferase (sialic acid O-acetyltransferase NeuD family)
MRDLLILGTGVHALEMVEIIERVNRAAATWNLIGLITADENQIGQSLNQALVVGTPGDLSLYPKAVLAPSWADLQSMGDLPLDRVVSLIDPTSFVSRTAIIGHGCVIYPHCFVGLRARLDDFVFCMAGSIINHDDIIGCRTAVTSGAQLAGSVTVEPDCYLGQACTIRQCLTIGHHSVIGMGAVVVKNVEPHSVMVGNPARKLRTNSCQP